MSHFDVIPLFPTPVSVCTLDDRFSGMGELLQKAELHERAKGSESNYELRGTFSKDRYILNQDIFAEFKQELTGLCEYFATNIMGLADIELGITQSWVNVKDTGQKHEPHRHQNSFISAVYYWQDDIVPMTFHRDSNWFPDTFAHDINYDNYESLKFYAEEHQIKLGKNQLVVFPSNLRHSVDYNLSEVKRYCLGFNTFPKAIGSHYALTRLEIDKL